MTQMETIDGRGTSPAVAKQVTRVQTEHASVLTTEAGNTTIANSVVAKIAGLAAREIDGVHQLVGSGAGAAISELAQRVTGSDAVDRGVNVEVGQREAAVDLKMVTVYGVSIADVAQAVRQNIITRVREMTGLIVKEVNIDVTDLYFPGEEQVAPEPAPQTPRRVS
ncbi:MAG TPA: Asp23/Gls24 family envelope stress response protein [Roseiflexaceae bacterium]|nr:Asp23/Gls24 family envelope stress response protein [Roseiflexaceae bacterium]